LQDYLDGDVSGPNSDDTLSLGGTTWNATVTDFEDASLALATGADGYVRFSAIGENIPDFATTATVGNETLVGTTGADTISALGGNDILVGRDGADILNGDSGYDMLLGGSGNDTLRGGTANDLLAGGTGADHFTYAETGFANSDGIVDYSYVEGDTIDLSALLDPAFVAGQPVSDFVRGVQFGSSIVLQVDIDGGGNSFVDVATLTSYGTNNPDLVRVTFEGTDHLLLV
jgi:Ca2+-binding RTX toxin-like protein